MANLFYAAAQRSRFCCEPAGKVGKLADVVGEELAHGLVGDIGLSVDHLGLELNIGFAADDVQAESVEHGLEMLLNDRR